MTITTNTTQYLKNPTCGNHAARSKHYSKTEDFRFIAHSSDNVARPTILGLTFERCGHPTNCVVAYVTLPEGVSSVTLDEKEKGRFEGIINKILTKRNYIIKY